MVNPIDSSHRRGRSRTRSVRRRRPTSLTSASGDDLPSTSERKKQDHSQSDKQDVAVPHISVQAPTPPLLQPNSSDFEAEHNDQSYRACQSTDQDAYRPFHDGNEEIDDKGKGKGKVLHKEQAKDNTNARVRNNRCTHVHHHHYHVHNHNHHYHVQDDKLVGEPIDEVEHSIYRVPPFDDSDPRAGARYRTEHYEKHFEQHKDVEKQKQYPQQNTRSGSTVTRVPASAPGPAQVQASSASRPGSTRSRVSFSRTLYGRRPERITGIPATHPYRENLQGNSAEEENWTTAPGASYSATALASADDEASAIVQSHAPHSQAPSPSGSHSTLTTISRGIVYGGRDRDDIYRSSDEAAAKNGMKNKKATGFRAWVARHLRG
ncbi:hypothetical protein F4811DRAFT_103534 [Daldinia bambusicola]|nr:hypothetical protein F4811DRAFT_103534 [Daldinia bambusicola]